MRTNQHCSDITWAIPILQTSAVRPNVKLLDETEMRLRREEHFVNMVSYLVCLFALLLLMVGLYDWDNCKGNPSQPVCVGGQP